MRLGLFVYYVLRFYETLIIVWCIFSWIPLRSEGLMSDIAAAVDRLVRPYIALFHRFIPSFGGIDFTPALAIMVLELIGRGVLRILL